MKKIILLVIMLTFTFQFSHGQNKKGASNVTKIVSGEDLDDYSSDYDGKSIKIHAYYESAYNESSKLRPRDKDTEKINSLYNHGITENMKERVGSNDDYYSRAISVYGTGSKIRLRIPFSIAQKIPNIDALGYVYVFGKWDSRSKTLIVKSIIRK